MHTHRLFQILSLLLVLSFLFPITAPSRPNLTQQPASAASAPLYPAGASLIPLGTSQGHLRQAYQALFGAIYSGQPVAWTADGSTYNSQVYPRGTLVGLNGLSGGFNSQITDGTYHVLRSNVLYPKRIAIFYSQVRDDANQVVTWEEATFETIFRVYLWGNYFKTVSEDDIISGALQNYDILILPSITIGYAEKVAERLGSQGQQAIADWVTGGGTLYAQGDSCYLAEASGLVPTGTVNLQDRVRDLPPYDNMAQLQAYQPNNPLTFSWLSSETYILDDPVLSAPSDVSIVAIYSYYSEVTHPGTPAILHGLRGTGQFILTNAHPSDQQYTYPLVFDALLMGMTDRLGLTGHVKQEFNPAVADDIIPAYEAGIPVRVTTDLRNYWNTNLISTTLTETVKVGFQVAISDIVPAPNRLLTGDQGTQIVWDLSNVIPGVSSYSYIARTLTNTLASGQAVVSTAQASYFDPVSNSMRHVSRGALSLKAKMAVRLNGDRDIELDGLYPLPAEGAYFDIALTLENKEETDAHQVVITDVVALLSPLVDVDDQRLIPTVLTNTQTMSASNETIWVSNEVFFYHNENYPLPQGIADTSQVINLGNWDGHTVYTFTNPLSCPVTIPPTYTNFISLTPQAGIRLPAVVLTFTLGDLQAYDYLDPAVRYGLFSRELFGRQVSFASDPLTDSGVVMQGSGGTVFTNLGGHPIPYHEYLSSGIIAIPVPSVTTTVSYQDIWQRPHQMDLRTVSYDIVPFPPPEYHAVVNTTYDMKVDFDGDGKRDESVLEYPSRLPANLHWMIKSHSNFDPAMPPLRKDETLISQGMFKGLGFSLNPLNGSWEDSWSFRDLQARGPNATVLTDVIDTPAYTFLYFQQELESQAYEVIDITGTLDASTYHREGVMKVNDGARFVYHQKAVGPSRYEVFDSHVQAVFGLRSDAQVSKRVAPVRIATYADSLYHFLRIQDPWEPRQFNEDPFIQSYGFGDLAATTYVGGRHQRELLHSRLSPGESTQVRLEINNNSGKPLTGVNLTVQAPPGITARLRTYTETTQIEPLFFDFPFLNAQDIPDAWKGVYYFDVQTTNPFPGKTGQVYTLTFTLEAGNLPAEFRIPPAQIGIRNATGQVETVYGPSTNLELSDRLPPWVSLRDARLANQAEVDELVEAINYDDAHPGSDTARTYFDTLRSGIVTSTITSTTGTQVTFQLPEQARTLPWQDNSQLASTLYVIALSDLGVTWSGTALADYPPTITFIDSFNQPQSDAGNPEYVEAHGALLSLNYAIRQINGQPAEPGATILPGTFTTLQVEGNLLNRGDDIAAHTVVTYALPISVTPVSAIPAWTSVTSNTVTWYLGDLGPGVQRTLLLDLAVKPDLSQMGAYLALVNSSDSGFLNIFAQRPVTAMLAGAFGIHIGNPQAYFNDFEQPVGSEWCKNQRSTTPQGARHFLGEFGNESNCLVLDDLPVHDQVHLELDLFILRSWDGNQVENQEPPILNHPLSPTTLVGPDLFNLALNGTQLFQTSFSNWERLEYSQSYPGTYPDGRYASRTGAQENNTLGYSYGPYPMDSVYHLTFDLPHTSDQLRLDLAAVLPQNSIEDESWGLDNIQVNLGVSHIYAPSSIFLPILHK